MFSYMIKIALAHLVINLVNCDSTTLTPDLNNLCDNTTQNCLTTETDETTIVDFSTQSEKPSSTTTTTKTTQFTTELPHTTEPVPQKGEETYKVSSECLCDLTSEKCDINCCCDSDCSPSDQSIFSFCSPDSAQKVPHSGLCFSHQFIYKNNTRYKINTSEKGLFCIAKDNFPDRLEFANQKVITSLERFNKVWNRRRHFIWAQSQDMSSVKFDNAKNYKYGSLLWKFDNTTNELNTIKLPIQVTSSFCSSTREVGYLENVKSDCLQKLVEIEKSCTLEYLNPQFYCDNLKLISKPTLFNQSNPEEVVNALVEVRPIICDSFESCLEVTSLPTPAYNASSKMCTNVVKSVNLLLYHNGSNGLSEGECTISLGTINTTSLHLKQSFNVEFRWAKNETNTFQRSGTPGYLESKPLISGKKVLESNKEIIAINNDPKEWVSLVKSNIKGDCEGNLNILFGENLQTQCTLQFQEGRVTKDEECSSLYSEIWTHLMGEVKINETDNQRLDIQVASFGDPVPENRLDWVPVHIENTNSGFTLRKAPCRTLLSGVQYQILYSHFGPFSNPQAKIVGVTARFLTNPVHCESPKCNLKLTSAVNFIDVSQHAINKFAKAPVVKIKLPHDFFYPFSSECTKCTLTPILLFASFFFLWY